jgi:hypothetical protein
VREEKGETRRRLIEGNAKSLRLTSSQEKDFAAAVYLPGTSSPLVLRWSSNFVESESGPIQSVKVLQYCIWCKERMN